MALCVDLTLFHSSYIMSQSRIRSFFSAVGEDDYAAQMQRERDEHAIAQEALLVQQATLRARHRRAREEGERRGPGRPRKRPAASIAITNSNNCSITAGDIIVIDSSYRTASCSSTAGVSTPATTSSPGSREPIRITTWCSFPLAARVRLNQLTSRCSDRSRTASPTPSTPG